VQWDALFKFIASDPLNLCKERLQGALEAALALLETTVTVTGLIGVLIGTEILSSQRSIATPQLLEVFNWKRKKIKL